MGINIDDIIEESDFKIGDFLRSRNASLVDISDIRELLEIYTKEINGKLKRKKYARTKVSRIENSLTPSGLKKVSDARKSIRLYIERSNKEAQMSSKIPPIEKKESTENYGFDDGPDEFIKKMQQWGNFPQDDRRYYLHMVFRYYLKQYHDSASKEGLVIQHPSYQYILDVLHPNGCSNKFPPEFRRFLIDSYGRTIRTNTLPVPVKGSSISVDYSTNFESDENVSLLRRRIQEIVHDWKERGSGYTVYPQYLQKGDINNNVIIERVCHAKKVKSVKEGLQKLKKAKVNVKVMENILQESELWSEIYVKYMSHVFKTSGEQLKERMGFFMRSLYRDFFYKIHNFKLVDDMFSVSGADLNVYVSFETFCNPKPKSFLQLDKEEICRPLLMILVEISFLFYVYENKNLASEDHVEIIKNCVDEFK